MRSTGGLKSRHELWRDRRFAAAVIKAAKRDLLESAQGARATPVTAPAEATDWTQGDGERYEAEWISKPAM